MKSVSPTPRISNSPPIWPIVSKATAAIVGGYVLTYWIGAAFAKLVLETGTLGRIDAGLASGLVQLLAYTVIILWVAATISIRTTWIVLAVLTGLCIGLTLLPQGPGAAGAAATGAPNGAASSAMPPNQTKP